MRLREFVQSPVYACAPTWTLSVAAREMEAHNVGSLVVTDDDDRIVGIITDRDLALGFAHGRTVATTVEEIMSLQVVTIPGHGLPRRTPPSGRRRPGPSDRDDLPRRPVQLPDPRDHHPGRRGPGAGCSAGLTCVPQSETDLSSLATMSASTSAAA